MLWNAFTRNAKPRTTEAAQPPASSGRRAIGLRVEACPPAPTMGAPHRVQGLWHACLDALWPATLSADARRRKKHRQRELQALEDAKDEFDAVLSDLPMTEVSLLLAKVHAARTLQELWHLRVGIFGAVSRHHSQDEADYRLGRMNRHFPTRSAKSGFIALDDAS